MKATGPLRRLTRLLRLALPLFGLVLPLAGCEQPPSADHLQPWTPADHDQEMTAMGSPSGQAPQAPPPRGEGGARPAGPSAADITWEQACASCHGKGGHGDGPSGPMVNAPDLTRPDVQDKFSDDELADVIANGRNKMPKFGLSDATVKDLVAKVRSLRGR